MTILYDPKSQGFNESMSSIDRAQVAMLRELASLSTDGRLILKGGLAMRACVGSMRLTKDVDFDRSANMSTTAAKTGVRRALAAAAQSARILSSEIDILKETETTLRVRLSGQTSAGLIKFVVEVSGRNAASETESRRETVTPPPSYGIAPFSINTYTHEMLAASKVLAAMSANRNVPRDIYDLNDLITTNPADILRARLAEEDLHEIGDSVLTKLSLITFAQAETELMPYIPPAQRAMLTQDAWDEMTLRVAERIQAWTVEALRERPPTDSQR